MSWGPKIGESTLYHYETKYGKDASKWLAINLDSMADKIRRLTKTLDESMAERARLRALLDEAYHGKG